LKFFNIFHFFAGDSMGLIWMIKRQVSWFLNGVGSLFDSPGDALTCSGVFLSFIEASFCCESFPNR
jgi:hypothetical protein